MASIAPLPKPLAIEPDNGPESGGTVVSITGENLGSSAEDLLGVLVADVPCKVNQYISSENIECTTGPKKDGGKGSVVVETRAGKSRADVRYTYNYAPVITRFIPDSGPIDGEYWVNITGKHFGEARDDVLSVQLAGVECKDIEWVNGKNILCQAAKQPNETSVEGPVVITTGGGGIGRSNDTEGDDFFRYNPTPLTRFVSPNNGPYKGGSKLAIYGANLGKSVHDILSIIVADSPCKNITAEENAFGLGRIFCVTTAAMEKFPPEPHIGPVIITTRSGGDGSKYHLERNAEFTYNPAPFVLEVEPPAVFSNTPTMIRIQGKWMGQSRADVKDILLAGRSCQIDYKTPSWINCKTPAVGIPLVGGIEIETFSGGIGRSNFTFEFKAQCEMYGNSRECSTFSCNWCHSTGSCVDREEECPSSCFLFRNPDDCNKLRDDEKHPCEWCYATTACLEVTKRVVNDQVLIDSSCPGTCSLSTNIAFSCGSLIIFFMWLIIALLIVGGFYMVIYFVNRDEMFAASLKKFASRMHPRNWRRRRPEETSENSRDILASSSASAVKKYSVTGSRMRSSVPEKEPLLTQIRKSFSKQHDDEEFEKLERKGEASKWSEQKTSLLSLIQSQKTDEFDSDY